jgi:hypothetical protein
MQGAGISPGEHSSVTRPMQVAAGYVQLFTILWVLQLAYGFFNLEQTYLPSSNSFGPLCLLRVTLVLR